MSKVAVIGLDGATFKVIKPMVARGELANIGKLMKEGAYGELESTTPIITPAAWSAMVSGNNPGKTGIYDFEVQKPDSYENRIVYDRVQSRLDLWDILSQNGKKNIVISVPATYPPKEINGIMISGMLTPPNRKDFITPETVNPKIRRMAQKNFIPWEELEPNQFMKKLEEKTDKKLDLSLELLKLDWDFFMVVFRATDIAGHSLWKYHDKTHPKYVKGELDYIEETYRMIDKKIGKLLDQMSEDTNVFIVSDHGMGPLMKEFYFNSWLEKKGYLKFKKPNGRKIKRESISKTISKLGMNNILKIIPTSIKKMFKETGGADSIDFTKTRVYSAGRTAVGMTYINTAHKPQGLVKPEEYEPLRDEIKRKLLQIKDGKNKVVSEAYNREELYSGKYVKDAPDIIFLTPNTTYRVRTSPSDKIFGDVEASGAHLKEGIFIVYGPDIKKKEIAGAKIADVCPTVLSLFEVPIPKDIDGKSLEIFNKTYKPSFADYGIQEKNNNREITNDDEEEVKERLRQLGYME